MEAAWVVHSGIALKSTTAASPAAIFNTARDTWSDSYAFALPSWHAEVNQLSFWYAIMAANSSQLRDYVTRTKASSPLGTSIFVGLRLLDPPLIYSVLAHGLASHLITALGLSSPSTSSRVNFLGLAPLQTVIFLMATGSSIKHIYWILCVSEQQMPAGTASFFGSLEVILDLLNSLLFQIASHPSSGIRSWTFVAGISLYGMGLFVETVSEIQRRNFKRKPANRGKPYSNGLFAWARNINYGGHTLWKSGFALVSGGWVWAAVIGGAYFYDFATRGVPVLDQYCQKRVGLRLNKWMRMLTWN